MDEDERYVPPEVAELERRKAKRDDFKRWLKRGRLVLGLAAIVLGVYAFLSYRIYSLPGEYHPESKVIQSPINDVMPGDTLLLQNLNLWREPKLGDIVIYEHPDPKDGVPGTLIGRVAGMPGETVRRNGPTMQVEDRLPLPVGFPLGEGVFVKDGDVIPEGEYLIIADNDAIGYADSRDIGYVSRSTISKRVTMNLSMALGMRATNEAP